jgi:hypothetical protein
MATANNAARVQHDASSKPTGTEAAEVGRQRPSLESVLQLASRAAGVTTSQIVERMQRKTLYVGPDLRCLDDDVLRSVFESGELPAGDDLRAHIQACASCRWELGVINALRRERNPSARIVEVPGVGSPCVSDERLAALAWGGAPTDSEAAHLNECSECQSTLERIRTLTHPSQALPVAALARSGGSKVNPDAQGRIGAS